MSLWMSLYVALKCGGFSAIFLVTESMIGARDKDRKALSVPVALPVARGAPPKSITNLPPHPPSRSSGR